VRRPKQTKYTKIKSVKFFWNKECENQENIQLPTPVTISQCTFQCSEKEYIDYDIDTKELFCSRCPTGTYSTPETTKIVWNEVSLSKFITKCEVNIFNEIYCQPFKLHTEKNYTSVIAGGDKLFKDAMYNYELIYNVQLKKKGRVLLFNIDYIQL
jgi:hypothetical protein